MKKLLLFVAVLTVIFLPLQLVQARGGRGGGRVGGRSGGKTSGRSGRRGGSKKGQKEERERAQRENKAGLLHDARGDTE